MARYKLALLALTLCASQSALSQSVDSLLFLRDVRHFTDSHRTPILVALGIGTVGAHGLVNGSFYASKHGGPGMDIHGAAEILGAFHFATSYAAGLDPLQAFGVALLGDVLFQIPINAAFGKPWYWQPTDYEAFGVPLPRNIVGPSVQIPLGLILILYKPILRAL